MKQTFISDLLVPEVETEVGKTRRMFEALPENEVAFTPHEKSMPLGRLAGHTADIHRLITLIVIPGNLGNLRAVPASWPRSFVN